MKPLTCSNVPYFALAPDALPGSSALLRYLFTRSCKPYLRMLEVGPLAELVDCFCVSSWSFIHAQLQPGLGIPRRVVRSIPRVHGLPRTSRSFWPSPVLRHLASVTKIPPIPQITTNPWSKSLPSAVLPGCLCFCKVLKTKSSRAVNRWRLCQGPQDFHVSR